ncbi:MAG: Smr/MutS family protein [Chitinophagaceae bacterium]
MKFSIDDPVYIISSQEEGKIIAFIDKETALVRVNKTEFHAPLSDLEHPYLRWFLDANKKKKQGKIYADQLIVEKGNRQFEEEKERGLFLVFFPKYKIDGFDETIDKINIYLYNDSYQSVYLQYTCLLKKQELFNHQAELLSNTNMLLHTITFEDMATTPQFSFYLRDLQDAKKELEHNLQIKPKRLHALLHQMQFQNHASFKIQICNSIEEKKKKEVLNHHTIVRKENPTHHFFNFEHAVKKSKYEVDLHIEKLTAQHQSMSNSEKLALQLKVCIEALDMAHATHQERIVLIHGIGNGKLKNEIHSILQQTNYILRYVYDYDSRYGYGATEAFLR